MIIPKFNSAACALAIVLLVVPLRTSFSQAQSPAETEQALKSAQAKIDFFYKQASDFLNALGHKDVSSRLEQSQKAWEKYRDVETWVEMGDMPLENDLEKQHYAYAQLRLTNERIEALQSAFDHQLCYPSDIRIRNGSNVNFKSVIVGDKKYGDIKRGEATAYQTWDTAFGYAYVSLLADSKPLKIQPIDFMGEVPLGEGKFTYVLTIENGILTINAVKDGQSGTNENLK